MSLSFKDKVKEKYNEIVKLFKNNKLSEAYAKALELYNSVAKKEYKTDLELLDVLMTCSYLLARITYSFDKFNEFLKWGNKYLNHMISILKLVGATDENIEDVLKLYLDVWLTWLHMTIANCILSDYSSALKFLKKAIGTSSKVSLSEAFIEQLGGWNEVLILLARFQIVRFLVISYMLNLSPKENKKEIMKGAPDFDIKSVRIAYELLKDEDKRRAIKEEYLKNGFEEEAFIADINVIKQLAKVYSLQS